MIMGVGRGALAPLFLKILTKKGCFLSYEWEKISSLLTPLKKILPTPMIIEKNNKRSINYV